QLAWLFRFRGEQIVFARRDPIVAQQLDEILEVGAGSKVAERFDREGTAPMGPDPPFAVKDRRSARPPRSPVAEHRPAEPVGVPRLERELLRDARTHQRRDQRPAWLEDPAELEQPRRP